MAKGKEIDTQQKREIILNLAKAAGIDLDQTYVAEVVRTGDKIILPEHARIPDVIKELDRQYKSEEQVISVMGHANVPPWDGARALGQAIEDVLGFATMMTIPGSFFKPEQPPIEIEVEVEYGRSTTVKWGMFELPGMEGATCTTGANFDADSGLFTFGCQIKCKRRYERQARNVLNRMRELAVQNALHRGKAFSIRFHDDEGETIDLPRPKFFPLDMEAPIFRRDLEAAIERNVFVPIRHSDALLQMGEPLKRGILFAGQYGVGKTMLAAYIAREAVANGWTFVYVKNSSELPLALKEAQRLQPAVVFAEDVDRIAGENRNDEVNQLLNQLDGVDSKLTKIMTVLTSNHPDKINEAMRRPGRIDLILQVLPPDSETIERMIRHFARGGLESNADLTEAAHVLQGVTPAHVREAVGRARLEALRRTGDPKALINGNDVAAVAHEVDAERKLFTKAEANDGMHLEALAASHEASAKSLRASAKNGKVPPARGAQVQ